MQKVKIATLTLAGLTLAPFAVLHAQRSSIYGGSGPGWWTAGMDVIFARQDDFNDATGQVSLVAPAGMIRAKGHPFFEALGPNGRACITCHQPPNGMSVTPENLRRIWSESGGKDAVFAAIDGSNCPSLPQEAMSSHSLLLDRGLFRIALAWPPRDADGNAVQPEFRIEVVNDPTGCNTDVKYGLNSAHPVVSVYRRPRMTANLRYVLGRPGGPILMADGRESTLRSQAIAAATTHEEGKIPNEEQLRQIVDFEMGVYAAQGINEFGGSLNEPEGPLSLGPDKLSEGRAPRIAGSLPKTENPAWRSFDVWRDPANPGDLREEFHNSVTRGSDLFFGRQFRIPSPENKLANKDVTCAGCHSSEAPQWIDIGTANIAQGKEFPALPLFRIICDTPATPQKYRGQIIYTQDPGRALISGKCADTGAIVMQQFHGLAARAPYFANGSAATLTALVEFYDRRFQIGLTPQEKKDLVNFLAVL